MKKHTFEEAIKTFKNRGYILLSDESEYQNCNSKLRYICPKHQDRGEQKITLSHLLSGRGCYYCGRERTIKSKIIELDKDSDRKLVESKNFEYVDTKREDGLIYIYFICNNHKELGVQRMRKGNMKRDIKGCKYCSGKKLPEWYVRKKINEINPHIELIGDYKDLTSNIVCKCTKHNHVYTSTAQSILNGHGCYYCGLEKLSKYQTLSQDEVIERVHKVNPHIDLIYYGGASDSSSWWYCNKHNKPFKRTLANLVNGRGGCDECYLENLRSRCSMGYDEFKRRLKEVHPSLVVLDKYVNNSTKLHFRCLEHNCDFYSTPANVLSSLRCCEKQRITYKEEQICRYIESLGISITRQKKFEDCVDKRELKFDIWLNDYNVIVEYDGEQHYRPVRFGGESIEESIRKFEYTQTHDQIKNEYCASKNIPLIRIPYFKFESMNEILNSEFQKLGII